MSYGTIKNGIMKRYRQPQPLKVMMRLFVCFLILMSFLYYLQIR